jgi:ribosomal-protein-alanine N-acetyltransferase
VALRKLLADPADRALVRADWRRGLPELTDGRVTLRELRAQDAASLVTHLNDPHVCRFIEPCPSTTAGFAGFIRWTHAERRRGKLACFGIVPAGVTRAVGVIQVWPIERDFSTAEWGFALGRSFWGCGLFMAGARLALDALFSQVGVYRLEARAVDLNCRGNRTLEKLGAKRDGVLRGAFHDGAIVRDHVMWSILAPEWQMRRARRPSQMSKRLSR